MKGYHKRLLDPYWYKDAIVYEVRVGSFYDSNDDGIGDFKGLIEKLDYLQDLGITAIWLLPFYPSPFKDDGYDISDYFAVHHQYGTLEDFKVFVAEAHARGLHVIIELVLNHTSDQHAWFKRAQLAPKDSDERNYYVWNDTPDKYKGVRIIFKDTEHSNWTWDPIAKAYFWHRFYSHQPDLNYDHPSLREAIFNVVDFWLDLGVDGMRLDGIPYLVEREGTSCDNLPETHDFIRALRRHMDKKFTNCMLLAEANQWPVDSIDYFGKGDECHMAFHFPIMPRLFMSIQLEDCFPLVDIINQTPEIPENAQWALFLRNHDELTLEMVTDEERDYMYRTYAQDPQARLNLGIRRRLAPLMGNDRRKIELMNAMLFSFPGTPFIYYADEIGMGDNIYLGDRNGVRTPMQWNIDRNAGFSKANSQKLCFPITMDPAYSYETVNVETQQKNPNSLLWWMKRLIALRKRFQAFGRGTIEFLKTKNPKIIAFIRKFEDELILVVGNFSRSIQFTELDLSDYHGAIPHELFGRTYFPKIENNAYFLTLAPFSFYWFGLHYEKHLHLNFSSIQDTLPNLEVNKEWNEIFQMPLKKVFETYLFNYLKKQVWLRNKETFFRTAKIVEIIPIPLHNQNSYFLLVSIEDDRGSEDIYALSLVFAVKTDAEYLQKQQFQIAYIHFNNSDKTEGMIYDGFHEIKFFQSLLNCFLKRQTLQGVKGSFVNHYFTLTDSTHDLEETDFLQIKIQHQNSGIIDVIFAEKYFSRFYRLVEYGINPEIEMAQALTLEKVEFVPQSYGSINYQNGLNQFTFALIQKYFPHSTSAWHYTLGEADRYFERIITKTNVYPNEEIIIPILQNLRQGPTKEAQELIGSYFEWARMIAEVTAKMHLTLATIPNENFIPQEPTPFYLRSNFQSKRNLVYKICQDLEATYSSFSQEMQNLITLFLQKKEYIIHSFEPILKPLEPFLRIRCHGDYHLGQLLYNGKELFIYDFGKGNERSYEERRRCRSALRDIAGMIRSFHLAIFNSYIQQDQKGVLTLARYPHAQLWPTYWQSWISGTFVRHYRKYVGNAFFVPQDSHNFILSLQAYLLETAIVDFANELKKERSIWLEISLRWILAIIEQYPKIVSLDQKDIK